MSVPRKSVNLKVKQARSLQISDLLLDARNVQILALLAGNPRMSVSELARSVGMSAPATRERIQRMEEAGVIRGYRLDIDPAALGYPITAIIRVRPMPGKLPKIAELAVAMSQVMECHRITGEDCFILKVGLDSLDNLDVILDQFLVYGQTTTSIVQSTPVAPRLLPLPGKR
jgi:Lrp/AsnC family transcriptional regulator, leucine-responsive regulatory protein